MRTFLKKFHFLQNQHYGRYVFYYTIHCQVHFKDIQGTYHNSSKFTSIIYTIYVKLSRLDGFLAKYMYIIKKFTKLIIYGILYFHSENNHKFKSILKNET